MEIYEEWLLKAARDLEGAIKLFEVGHSLPDLAAYHAQQCAEKAFKAYLAYKFHPLEKTHDLSRLVSICQNYDSTFGKLISRAAFLNGFDVKFRYSSDDLEPTPQETQDAIQYAQEVLDFVRVAIG